MLDLTTLGGLWLMDRERLGIAHAHLREFGRGARPLPTPQQMDDARKVQAANKAMRKVTGNVAVIPISGIVEQKMSMMGYLFGGGTSTEAVHDALDQCMAARDIGCVVLDIDSPGGTSYGVQELADHIRECADKKPIHAVANPLAASAAYWLAAAASSVTATPSGDVGSVGVYAVHMEFAGALEQQGIKVSIIKAGKFKAEGNEFEPLDQESRDYMQTMVDGTYAAFVKALAGFRGISVGDVRSRYGEGRVMSADQALAAGLVDRVATMRQVLDKLSGGPGQAQAMRVRGRDGLDMATSAEVLRLRHRRAKERTVAD